MVGLCTLVLYPELSFQDKKLGYIYAMRDFLPLGMKGLLVAAFFAYAYIKFIHPSYSTPIVFPESLFYIAGFTTVVWIVVTFFTKPVDSAHLKNFYRRIHPGGMG